MVCRVVVVDRRPPQKTAALFYKFSKIPRCKAPQSSLAQKPQRSNYELGHLDRTELWRCSFSVASRRPNVQVLQRGIPLVRTGLHPPSATQVFMRWLLV